MITKDGQLKELAIKEYSVDSLYRRAGFKQASGFGEKLRWTETIGGDSRTILAFGKTVGRAPQKNVFRFPAETLGLSGDVDGGDQSVFFGNIILVAMAGDALAGLKKVAFSQAMEAWTFFSESAPSADAPSKERGEVESPPPASCAGHSAMRPPQSQLCGGIGIRRVASKPAVADEVKNCFDCSVELTEEAYI